MAVFVYKYLPSTVLFVGHFTFMMELGKYVIMTPFIEVTYTIASESFKTPSAFMSGSQLVSSTKWRHT